MASKIALQQMKMNMLRNEPLNKSIDLKKERDASKLRSQIEIMKKRDIELKASRERTLAEKKQCIAAWKKSDEEIAEEWLKGF